MNMRLTGGVLRGGEGHWGLLAGVFFLEENTRDSNTDWSGAGTGDLRLMSCMEEEQREPAAQRS